MKQEWVKYRSQCLKNAFFRCESCGKTDVVLQVHHPHYYEDREPWEYPIAFCHVLCKGCHAEEHGLIPPRSGWILLHSDWDDGESSGETLCEKCETPLKWQNVMWHPEWGEMVVGYECADQLGNRDAHESHKRELRRRSFIASPRWRDTPKGVMYKHGEIRVFILKRDKRFILKIKDQWGKLKYHSLDDAKRRAALVIHS